MFKKATKKPVEVSYMEYADVKKEFEKDSKFLDGRINKVKDGFTVETLEGHSYTMTEEDHLMIGPYGELYPIKINIFNETYRYKIIKICKKLKNFGIIYIENKKKEKDIMKLKTN